MKHDSGTFTGAKDKSIFYQSWLPDGDIRAVLFLVHGLAEHSGRYMNVVNHFVPLGYAVYGLDHIGHGQSEGNRVFVEDIKDFTHTLKIYFDMVRKWQAEAPIFILGHSMGGLLSSLFLLDHQADLAGAILSGPAVMVPDNTSAATIGIAKILSSLLPKVGLIPQKLDLICRDEAVVEACLNDPFVYQGKTTSRLAGELLKGMQQITVEANKIILPLIIVQGGTDHLVSPDGAQKLYDLVGSKDKTLKIYDGFYHEVFNEPEKELVLGDVQTWLENQLG